MHNYEHSLQYIAAVGNIRMRTFHVTSTALNTAGDLHTVEVGRLTDSQIDVAIFKKPKPRPTIEK